MPTSIVDKNGRQTTVHKKLMTGNGSGNTSLPAPGASGESRFKGIDWSRATTAEVIAQARLVAPTLSDPTHLWDNLEFYTGILNSHHHVEARALFEKDQVLSTLRDAWLDMHGMVLIKDSEKYYKIKGPNGYDAFLKARDALLEAHTRPTPSKNTSSTNRASESGSTTSWSDLNPFAALRRRRERKDREYQQQWNVRLAVDQAFPSNSDRSDNIVKTLNTPELLAKASEMVDLLSQIGADNEELRNFARGLGIDDNEHTILKAMHGHKDYVASKPEYIGLVVEVSKYLKAKGLDYQQEDGRMPHLEGYVEAFAEEGRQHLLLTGETEANLPTKHHLERAIRRHDKARSDRVY